MDRNAITILLQSMQVCNIDADAHNKLTSDNRRNRVY